MYRDIRNKNIFICRLSFYFVFKTLYRQKHIIWKKQSLCYEAKQWLFRKYASSPLV